MSEKKYCASLNDEMFPGDKYDSREEAVEQYSLENDLEKGTIIFVGEVIELNTKQFLCATWLLDDMRERADQEAGEAAEDYLKEITAKQEDELEEYIAKWFDENGFKPYFCGVDNIKEVII